MFSSLQKLDHRFQRARMTKTNYISKFLISHYAMDDVNLFALYNTKTDLSEERRKEGKICKNVLYNFHCFFKGNNKNFRFMSPLSGQSVLSGQLQNP